MALIDEVDTQIIQLLRENGRMPNTEIAKNLKISEGAIRKRLKKLFDNELIQVVAVINASKLGFELQGNIHVKVDIKKIKPIMSKLQKMDEIWYIAHLTGAIDFDLEFRVKSQDELDGLMNKINNLDGVKDTATSFRLKLVKNVSDWEIKDGFFPISGSS
ncbi:MAG: AsnC family transcriptional regulator [Desulfobacterales bacterium]|nr:AsnC family transcriptional regulator [Desulfobacterales bacterium]